MSGSLGNPALPPLVCMKKIVISLLRNVTPTPLVSGSEYFQLLSTQPCIRLEAFRVGVWIYIQCLGQTAEIESVDGLCGELRSSRDLASRYNIATNDLSASVSATTISTMVYLLTNLAPRVTTFFPVVYTPSFRLFV